MRAILGCLTVLLLAMPAWSDEEGANEVLREKLEIGKSLSGRPIVGVRFGLAGPVALRERPTLLVVAGLDADHKVGIDAARSLEAGLLKLAAREKGVRESLCRCAVEILPLLNPDGLAALGKGPGREMSRNMRPVDEDRDGEVDEDGPEDLNGDGWISVMRIRDPRGPYRVSDEDPRLMVPADPVTGERGTWRLVVEGLDDDGDGRFGEDGPGGVGLDRNFAHGWARHDPMAGTSPPSEPETRALIEHVLRRSSIACVLVYGRHDNLSALPPAGSAAPGKEPDGPPAEDRHWFERISREFTALAGVEPCSPEAPDGAFHQWAYYQMGIPAFSTPLLYPVATEPSLALPSGKEPVSEEARWLAFADRFHDGRGFVPWKKFEHPGLGEVEIGGFVPDLRLRAPESLLPGIVSGQSVFVGILLSAMPKARWARSDATELAEGVYEVRATLVSERIFPLVTAMGRTTRAAAPVRVLLQVEGEILTGRGEMVLRRLAGDDRVREFRWVIRGAPGQSVLLRAVTARGGSVDALLELE